MCCNPYWIYILALFVTPLGKKKLPNSDPTSDFFFEREIFRYFQNLTVRLNLYFCKEFLLPLLSVLLGAFGLRVSFFSLIFFHSFTSFFIFALFSYICFH